MIPPEFIAPEKMLPGLADGRWVVGDWLIGELAAHLGVSWKEVLDAFNALPTNYANLLDSPDGVNLLAAVVGDLLGASRQVPFYARHH